jgi:porin
VTFLQNRLIAAFAAGTIGVVSPGNAQEVPGLGSGLSDAASGTKPARPADLSGDPWAPVQGEKISLADVAPVLLPFLNNGPVFGLPGTTVGDVFHRTQLTGDWGGARTKLVRQGLFIDAYSTLADEDISSGGLKTGSHVIINNQLSLNLDTGRANLWAGGILHVTVQERSGDKPQESFTSGASVPTYTGLVLPEAAEKGRVRISEYYVAQALGKQYAIVAGKISDVFLPDQTAFANSYRYYFTNFNFNKNPMTTNFYGPTAWAVLGAWKPSEHFSLLAGVTDPYTEASNFAKHAFKDQNYYAQAIISYQIGKLPGQIAPSFNWSNQPQLDLAKPFGPLALAQLPQAIGALVGSPETEGLPMQTKSKSWFAIANFSQYLWTPHSPQEIVARLNSGQPLRGIGIIGRVGYAPERTNTVARQANLALFARGVIEARPDDSFGAGYYYNGISHDLKQSVSLLSRDTIKIHNERGAEVFYHFAVTPAVRLIPSYQHIWDPLAAGAAAHQNHADIGTVRITVAW